MKVETYKCDVCGKQKQESNHWFMLNVSNGFLLFAWSVSEDGANGYNHLCSEQCVMKALSKWMADLRKPATSGAEEQAKMLRGLPRSLPS